MKSDCAIERKTNVVSHPYVPDMTLGIQTVANPHESAMTGSFIRLMSRQPLEYFENGLEA